MTTRLPAWVAICAVFAAQFARVYADAPFAIPGTQPLVQDPPARRQIAVIDLSEDPTAYDLSGKIYAYINQGPDRDLISIPDKRGLDAYLVNQLVDEESDYIDRAKDARKAAKDALDAANAEEARSKAQDGERQLAHTVPSAATLSLYTDLTMVEGLAQLELGKKQEAEWAFALTRRLDPNRTLDAAAYPPDTVEMFNRAAATKTVRYEVQGKGRVWIDWVERGQGPGTFDVEVGEHVIVVAGADRMTTAVMPVPGESFIERPGQKIVKDDPAGDAVKVKRARLALSRAQAKGDDAARASAMNQLADLLAVHDAVLVSKRADGKLQWETWRDRAPGFSAPQMYTTQKPAEILEPLVPVRPNPPIEQNPTKLPPFRPVTPEGEQQWYQKGWVQASIAGGVILAIVGGVLIASRDRPIQFMTDVKSQ
ncbi:MAG: hypothetical protein QM831_05260 [Kofleriaceae bacterium]